MMMVMRAVIVKMHPTETALQMRLLSLTIVRRNSTKVTGSLMRTKRKTISKQIKNNVRDQSGIDGLRIKVFGSNRLKESESESRRNALDF
jgi:hypothetical protein